MIPGQPYCLAESSSISINSPGSAHESYLQSTSSSESSLLLVSTDTVVCGIEVSPHYPAKKSLKRAAQIRDRLYPVYLTNFTTEPPSRGGRHPPKLSSGGLFSASISVRNLQYVRLAGVLSIVSTETRRRVPSTQRAMSGNDHSRTNDREEYIIPEYTAARRGTLPIQFSILREQKQRSPSSVDELDDRSESSFQTTSTAPSSIHSNLSTDTTTVTMNYGYELCCPFEFVGCELSFHPTQIDAYISHTTTHFFEHRPPPKTICIFCHATFENPNDRVANWTERMYHIADHYRRLERFEHSRPDFFVIEYMRKKRIINKDDYKWATRHTERPECDGLVDFGHKTEEMMRKEEKSMEERHDLRKDDRNRREYIASRSRKGKRHN